MEDDDEEGADDMKVGVGGTNNGEEDKAEGIGKYDCDSQ